jgi:hypothetical protein
LGNLLRSEEVCEDWGVRDVWQFAGSSQWILADVFGGFSFCCKGLVERCGGASMILGD